MGTDLASDAFMAASDSGTLVGLVLGTMMVVGMYGHAHAFVHDAMLKVSMGARIAINICGGC